MKQPLLVLLLQPLTLLQILFILNNFLLVNSCTFYKRESKIHLLNNGYENILVAIDESIEIENKRELIERLKDILTRTSSLLFNVTQNRAYFREVTLLVPHTWTLGGYKIDETTWESLDKSDICISPRENSNKKRTWIAPFVYNYASECGQSGMHLHMTSEYLMNTKRALNSFGNYENVLVHEWSKLRYGVYNEHSYRHEDGDFYFNENGEIDAIRCTSQVTGKIRDSITTRGECTKINQSGLPHNRCIFEDDFDELHSKDFSSLMYRPIVPQLGSFCNQTTHNKLAPNAQNRECNHRSVWQVLEEHNDFDHGKNEPNRDAWQKPLFRIVKERNRRFILLIDKTIGFNAPQRELKLKRALEDFINIMIRDGDQIGIIHFASFSKVTLGLTQVRSGNDRKHIVDHLILKSYTNRSSNIWSALSLGLMSLKNSLDDELPDGATLILITQAHEIEMYPKKEKIFEQLKAHDITVDTIAFSFESDKHLELLAQKTNGLSFRLSDDLPLLDLSHILQIISNRDLRQSHRIQSFFNNYERVEAESELIINLNIDSTVTRRYHGIVRFRFDIDYGQSVPNIEIKEPHTYRIFSPYTSELCYQTHTYVLCDFSNPQPGNWDIRVVNNFNENINVRTSVCSFTLNDSEFSEEVLSSSSSSRDSLVNNQITIEALWKAQIVHYPRAQVLYVLVSREFRPILDVHVEAYLYAPDGEQFKFELFDNGLNADRYKNDGVYSRFFTSYTSNGPYCAMIFVKSKNNSVIHSYKLASIHESGNLYPTRKVYASIDENAVEPLVEAFERTLMSTSFLVKDLNEDLMHSDKMAPSKIKDFKLKRIYHTIGEVQFEFTAPGDDCDYGKADLYEIILGTNPKTILEVNDDQHTLNHTHFIKLQLISSTFSRNLIPNPSGTKENFMIKIAQEHYNDVIAIKIRALDAYANKGDWSEMCVFKLNKQNIHLAKGVELFVYSNVNGVTSESDTLLNDSNQALLSNSKNNNNNNNHTLFSKRYNRIKVTLVILILLLFTFFIIFILIKLLKEKFWPSIRMENDAYKIVARV